MTAFLRRLTRGMTAEASTLSDSELVQRFLETGDAGVFEALVCRHGPMVYRVCWRAAGHDQDAEDAFQAAFLILARNLRSVRNRTSLASWLHGVARRVAIKARARTVARKQLEKASAPVGALPPDELAWGEMRGALDAELVRLPEKWRLPLVLCYLEGRTQDEAAHALGWSKSTLRRRLDAARVALTHRLTRRGVWPAALGGVLVSDCAAPAALPSALVTPVLAAAAEVANGRAVLTGISASVNVLTQGVLTTMTTRLKLAMIAAFLLATIGWSAVGLLDQSQAAPPPAAERPLAKAADTTAGGQKAAPAAPAKETPEEKVKKLKLVEVYTNTTNYTTKPTPDAPRPPVIHFFWGKKNEVRVAPGESALVELPKRVREIFWHIPGYVPDGAGNEEDGPEFDYVYCKWERNGSVTFTMYRKP